MGDNGSLTATIATGAPAADLASAWEPVPAVLAGAALATVLYTQAFVRLRRRGRPDHAPAWRGVAFGAGLSLLVLALVSPLDRVAEEELLSAHMLQHVIIADAAAALIVLGLSGPLLFFFLPPAALGQVARSRPLRGFLSFLVRPPVALAIWCVVIATWHIPAVYDATLDSTALHDLEHASFIVAGLLVWYQLLDPARHGRLSRPGRLAYAVVLFAGGQILALVLIFSFEPLYPAYASLTDRPFGLSALTDQRLAGVVMMGEQTITLGCLAAYLLLTTGRSLPGGEQQPSLTAEPRP